MQIKSSANIESITTNTNANYEYTELKIVNLVV